MVPAETPREDTFGGMSLGAIRAAKRDAKRREERGLDGVDGDAGKVSSTRRRNLRAKQRILVFPRVRHEVAEASEGKHAHGNAVRGALTEAQGEERVHHADANERGLIRDATRRPRRRVSRRQLSRDGVVGFTTPRRFHHPAHLPVRHEKGDEFERAEKIGGFLRRERGSPRTAPESSPRQPPGSVLRNELSRKKV